MKIIEILNLLQKYDISESYPLWAEHDIIGFNVDYEKISEEDINILQELGCFFDEGYDSLIIFVQTRKRGNVNE